MNQNKYLYGGKEYQDEVVGGTPLELYDYEARMYDPVIGRWGVIDPLAENAYHLTPYRYSLNEAYLSLSISNKEFTVNDVYQLYSGDNKIVDKATLLQVFEEHNMKMKELQRCCGSFCFYTFLPSM